MGKNYLENFVQSTFDALKATNVPVEGGTLVVGGDGRYYNKARANQSPCLGKCPLASCALDQDAIQIITKMAVANGVKTIWIGKDQFRPSVTGCEFLFSLI